MPRLSQPPSYEQVATADHALEETISLSSVSTKVQENEDDGKVRSKDDSVLIDKQRDAVESIGTNRKGSTTSTQRSKWQCLSTGNGWLWEIIAMCAPPQSKFWGEIC